MEQGNQQGIQGRIKKVTIPPSKVVLFLGSRGTGKSTRMYALMKESPRFLIYDPLDQPLYREFESYNAQTLRSLKERIDEVASGKRRIMRLRYVAWEDDDAEFERVCRIVDKARVSFVFIVEEVASHIRGHSLTRNFYRLVRTSRNFNKGIWMTTQHPKMIPPKVRNNVDMAFVFKLYEPESIKYAKSWFGEAYSPESLEEYGYYLYIAAGSKRLLKYPPMKVRKRLLKKSTEKGTGRGIDQEDVKPPEE